MATKPRSERQDISFHDELKRLLSKLRLHAAYLTKRAVHETGDEPLPDELLGRTCEQALLRQE
ncbi:MAG: hypothetical protein R3F54_30530 [Alphaproteobacteria bacterium]